MINYLKDHPGVFTPDEIKLLTSALNQAWAKLQASGVAFGIGDGAERARLNLAKLIVEAASNGERDLGSLVDGALSGAAVEGSG